jgi:hypothetical protein
MISGRRDQGGAPTLEEEQIGKEADEPKQDQRHYRAERPYH